jgi:hypothetical protein
MANEMTAREQRFAALLLETTKVDAYNQAGYSQKGSRATQTVDAYRLSKRPKVRREVARLLQQRAFPADDYKRLQETAIAGMTEIFLYDPDARVRLKAGALLLAYAAEGLKLRPQSSAEDRAVDSQERAIITAELRTIYARAGLTWHGEDAAPEHPEVIAREQELMVEPAEEEAEPLVEAAEIESALHEDEAPEPEPAMAEGSFIAEHRNPAVQFRLEAIPGYFPPKYRRVPIQR